MPTDRAGNDTAHARNLGRLSTALSATDGVDNADPDDYYKFTLTQSSVVTVATSSMRADVDLSLLSDSGEVITSSASTSASSDQLRDTLDPGTYYVRVSAGDMGYSRYNLRLTRAVVDMAGNTRTRARDLGELDDTPTDVAEDVGGTSDRIDYYRFTLTQSSALSIQFSDMTRNLTFALQNVRGNTLRTTTLSSRGSSFNRNLAAGTYYVAVGGSTNTNYSAQFTARPTAPTTSAGTSTSSTTTGNTSSRNRADTASALVTTAAATAPLTPACTSLPTEPRSSPVAGMLAVG
jgi:hypothetical protein